MPCYHPIKCFKAKGGGITFSTNNAYIDIPMTIPCNQCIGCKLQYSMHWATRMVHENQMHDSSMFITLTYDDEHLPTNESLNLKHFQDFMKRYRFKIKPIKIKFFHCGEYGSEQRRPHYHAIIFGHEFNDLELWKRDDNNLYISDTLSKIWGMGFCTIAQVTYETAQYVAKYVTKKITYTPGKSPDRYFEHYQHITRFGELVELKKEYATMSRNKAIGRTWYDKFQDDCYPSDFISIKGKKKPIPKYYDRIYQTHDETKLKRIKKMRIKQARKQKHDQTVQRLNVREQCAYAKLNKGKL